MNELDAIKALARERHIRNIVMPRYTPAGWFECDLFEMTKAGFFKEYEVKLTRADFFKDADKDRVLKGHYRRDPAAPRERKHDLLRLGDPRGPVGFYYVTPAGMVKPEEIPAHAGWIELIYNDETPFWRIGRIEKKPAPRLHKVKVSEKVIEHVNSVAYWRFFNMLLDKRKVKS